MNAVLWVLILTLGNGPNNPPDVHISVVFPPQSKQQCEQLVRSTPEWGGLSCVREDDSLFKVPYIAAELADAKTGWK